MKVGILSTGICLLEEQLTTVEMGDIPSDMTDETLEIMNNDLPWTEDPTFYMGVQAAKKAIGKASISPLDLDLIIYLGEEFKEYPLRTSGMKLQEELGANNAWAFDVSLRCSTTIKAVKLAKSLMLANPEIYTVLLAGGCRNGELFDYQNSSSKWMLNLSTGGGAILLQKGLQEHQLVETGERDGEKNNEKSAVIQR